MYKIQSYDDDIGWQDWESDSGLDAQGNEFASRSEAEEELHYLRRRYCGKFRVTKTT